MTAITLINPWSQAVVHKDITGLAQCDLDAYAEIMDDESREAVYEQGHDTPEALLAAWVDLVGPEKAGIVILGS